MNRSLREHEYAQEAAFAVGAFLGMLIFAIGIASLVLALSVGLPRGAEYLGPGVQTVLLAVGAILLVGGLIVRLYRDRLMEHRADQLKLVGALATLVGFALFLFGASAETTVSAPFLTSSTQKVVLFGMAYGLIAVGLVVLRGAARIVGW